MRNFFRHSLNSLRIADYSIITFTVLLLLLICHPIDAQRNSFNSPNNADLARVALVDQDANPNQPASVVNLESVPVVGSPIGGNGGRAPTAIVHNDGPTPVPSTVVVLVITDVFSSFLTLNITITRTSSTDDANDNVKQSPLSALVYYRFVIFYSIISVGILLLIPIITLI